MRALVLLASALAVASFGRWERLPSLPDREGLAGPYAGVSGGALLVGGGANFPDKKPWEGGTKVWYDTVFVLERPGGPWKVAGKLPRPLGYGVSTTSGGGVICAGGSDATRHYADCFSLGWVDGRLLTFPLPSLPRPIANAVGAQPLGSSLLYVAGGQETPHAKCALRSVYTLDLSAPAPRPGWREIEPLPGPGRILPVAVAYGREFWVIGGAELYEEGGQVKRRYLTDTYRYRPGEGRGKGTWKRMAEVPRPVTAAPSPAPETKDGFVVLGGDDGSQVGTPPERHSGFGVTAWRYRVRENRWEPAGRIPAARVTVPTVLWRGRWTLPSGEARPGVRSPEVWAVDAGND